MGRECTRAVILAAGAGTRLRSIEDKRPKCLTELGGKPVIEWILSSLKLGGIRRVTMVTGYRGGQIRAALGRGRRYGLDITYVNNSRWREPNGISLYSTREAVNGEPGFLTLMSDHILPPAAIARVRTSGSPKCLLAVDTDLDNVFDIHDATKLRLVDGRPEAIGKKLHNYNAVDCGLFRFDERMFEALEYAFARGKFSLTAGVKKLIADGDLDVIPIGRNAFWIDIDTPRSYRHAERSLPGSLKAPAKN